MHLHELAGAFARLEATTSRREMIGILAELLDRADEDELEPIVYLAEGQLRPPYEGIEFGVGEKLLIRVLAQVFGQSEDTILRRFKQEGDLGLVAEALAPAKGKKELTVREAYDSLLEVARATGRGSKQRKISLLAELLGQVCAQEAKYLVRIVQGRLRLGVGDQTILAAIATGALKDSGKKDLVEHAYNVHADLGRIARIAYTKGEKGLRAVGPQVGTPVRPALAQRVATVEEILKRLKRVQLEPKYDGFRLQLHRDGDELWAFSRRLENVTEMFPEVTKALRRQLKAERAIIEGEAIVYNPETGEYLPFQVTMTRKRKYKVEEMAERYPLRLFAFDLLYAEGKDYIPRPLRERHRQLRKLITGHADDPVAVTRTLETAEEKKLREFFDEMVSEGLEGIMAKRVDAPYHAGARNYNWVKLKRGYRATLGDTVDVVLVGYLVGRGKRAALGIGSLLGAVYDPEGDRFRTVAKIGSGPSEEEWKELKKLLDEEAVPGRPRRVDSLIEPDVWVEPKYVVTVVVDEITRSPMHTAGKKGKEPGYALRFPRLIGGIRTDKAPEDATTEEEILQMYKMQAAGAKRSK